MEPQILLKVRFADVDRSRQPQPGHQPGQRRVQPDTPRIGTGIRAVSQRWRAGTLHRLQRGQHSAVPQGHQPGGRPFRRCEAKNLLQMLAEPNVLAINGKPASFLAGGEFPYPHGAAVGAAALPSPSRSREYGVRLNFLPDGHAARHHPPAGDAGSQLARLHQRGDHSRASPSPACPRAACRPKSNWRAARAS